MYGTFKGKHINNQNYITIITFYEAKTIRSYHEI